LQHVHSEVFNLATMTDSWTRRPAWPSDMELVTRQSERFGHQQRLLQVFTEDVFIFSLLVYIAHFWTIHSTIYLLTYLLT